MTLANDAHFAEYGPHERKDCPLPPPEHKHSTAKSHRCPLPPCPRPWPSVTVERKGKKVQVPKPYSGSAYAAELADAGELDALDEAPKMDELVLDIEQVLAGVCRCCRDVEDPARTNKVVVFSYHKFALRVLAAQFGEVAVRYDGDMSLKQRNAAKQRFQRDPSVRLFLTSDAGGYGVDLPQANHLFNMDVPFTAGKVVQRNARVRRANLDFHTAVHVRSYLVENSLEVYYADVTESKQKVSHAVRTGKGTLKGGVLKMSADNLSMFLVDHLDEV